MKYDMLNASLPIAKLHEDLNPYLKSWRWLLHQLDPEKEIPLLNDKALLGKLHHALNISKYSQHEFREELLLCATSEQIKKFAEKCNIPDKDIEPNNNEFRKQLSKYKWQNDDKTRIFIDVFGYPDYLIPNQKSSHNSEFIYMEKNTNPYKPLKDYQSEIFYNVERRINIPYYKALIQMPTGSGKTRVAMEIVSSFLNHSPESNMACRQIRIIVEAFMEISIQIINSNIPNKIKGTCFIVSMYQKLRNPYVKKRIF